MASVRKRYNRGGRVPVAETVAAPPPPPVFDEPDDAPALNEADAAVLRALAAQRRAEELARSHQQAIQTARPMTEEQYRESVAALSAQKQQWLRDHPELSDEANGPVMKARYAEAQRSGIEDDSPEMLDYLLTGRRRDDAGKFEPEIERQPAPPPPAPPPTPPVRKSMPITAPVARAGVPSISSGRRDDNRVTLSPEEVRIAHNSFTDPTGKMTNADKEREYAANKLRLRRMREAGNYPMPERN